MTVSVAKDREIGKVIGITHVRVTVELYQEVKSAVRSYPGGLSTVAQIGAYLLFPIGVGECVVGTVTGAYENELYEPDTEGGMSLQLSKPRRTLRVNLLGTLLTKAGKWPVQTATNSYRFQRGITIYPTLEASAVIPTEDELQSILTNVASEKEVGEDSTKTLPIGRSPIYPRVEIRAAYDDLFSRPLAVVGNTGSGKSWTICSLIQEAIMGGEANSSVPGARITILDINGEYWKAFKKKKPDRMPDTAYIDGSAFVLPLWCMNLQELAHVFQVTEARQIQFPVLERMVTFARQFSALGPKADEIFQTRASVQRCRTFAQKLIDLSEGRGSQYNLGTVYSEHASALGTAFNELKGCSGLPSPPPAKLQGAQAQILSPPKTAPKANALLPEDIGKIRTLQNNLFPYLDEIDQKVVASSPVSDSSADAPYAFAGELLDDPRTRAWVLLGFEGEGDIRRNLPTMFLRIRRTLSDPRWHIFTRPTAANDICKIGQILSGDACNPPSSVTVIDCSMIAYDVLPFFCAAVGRLLLDIRRHAGHDQRTNQPWVLVLEEAHNYLRPFRQDEDRGISLSRESFERIAKEGRKFGLSLVIASQRPRDVSDTVLSQCANFIVHRIQNPEDLEYFRKIIPVGSRDMLDQVPILGAGEGLLVGSAVNVPSRVKVAKPDPTPESDTPTPSAAWRDGKPSFDIQPAVNTWLGRSQDSEEEG